MKKDIIKAIIQMVIAALTALLTSSPNEREASPAKGRGFFIKDFEESLDE